MPFAAMPQGEKEDKIYKGQSTVYYEFLGISGSFFSLQYDRVIVKNTKSYINASGGVGYYFAEGKNSWSVPLSINYSTGIKTNSHFEVGFALTYVNQFSNEPEMEILYGGVRLGYKFQARDKMFFRISVSPMGKILEFEDHEPCTYLDCDFLNSFYFFGGLSIGYSF